LEAQVSAEYLIYIYALRAMSFHGEKRSDTSHLSRIIHQGV